jgi:hypothetical protein
MHDSLALNIRRKLADYLAGQMSLAEFKDWFVGATWDVDSSGDPDAINLTYEVWHVLSEFDVDQNVNDLHRALEAMIAPATQRR